MVRTNMKVATFGAIAALGLMATGALAQPQSAPGAVDRAQASQQSQSDQEMRHGGQSMMMNDPEMRQEMMEMMKKCNRMMDRMANMANMSEGDNQGS